MELEALLGTRPWVFVGITVVLMGFAAYMTGQAVANTWRPMRHVLAYCALLGFGSRFLHYALFDGVLLSATGFAADVAVLLAIGYFGYRVTLAAKMCSQYPWLFERTGPWGYRERSHSG